MSAAAPVVLSCLGVDLAVEAALAEQCRGLPRSEGRPVATVRGDGVEGVAALTAAAVEHTGLLALHACVALGGDGVVAVPGRSGLGKSTLSLALLGHGFHHLSDEALALDRTTAAVTPFARPISIDARSWSLLDLAGAGPVPGHEALVDPAAHGVVATGGGRVSDLVLAVRGDGPPQLTRTTGGEAMSALIPRCFNHHRDAANSLQVLAEVIDGARVWRATYSDARKFSADLAATVGIPD